jgi:hypothetical protein
MLRMVQELLLIRSRGILPTACFVSSPFIALKVDMNVQSISIEKNLNTSTNLLPVVEMRSEF